MLVLTAAVGWQLRGLGSLAGNFAAAAFAVSAAFCYFRFLGRLARNCQQWIREAEEPAGRGHESLDDAP
jgi:hypothetical protein